MASNEKFWCIEKKEKLLRKMKLKKNYFIILFLIILFFPSCVRNEIAYNFQDEVRYSQVKEQHFFIDYLKEGSDALLEKGWSKLRNGGSRLGAYPRSRLNFIVHESVPLNLFILCKPVKRGKYAARKLCVEINNQELTQVGFKERMARNIKIPISSEFLQNGKNILEFIYLADKPSKGEISLPQEKKREFSLIFNELILTSSRYHSSAKRFAKMEERIREENESILIQKIPSMIDFYLELPARSFFKARYKFFSFEQMGNQREEYNFQISLQQPEEDEKIIHSTSLGSNTSENKLNVDLSAAEGITRFRLKVGNFQKQNILRGFLVWTEASIVKKREEKKRDISSDKNLAKLRDSLSDKNTIIIVLDAARADHFSNYGYFRPTTPNISRFSEEATIFTNGFSESLTTRTSIGTLFTGLPLSVTGLTKVVSKIPEKLTTLAQLFKSKGFKTTGFTGVGNIGSTFNFHRGFDEYFELYRNEGFRRKSQEYIPYLFPWLEANKNKKFFLYIHFKEPHSVYIPLPPFQGMFSGSYKKKVNLAGYTEKAETLMDEEVEYIRACYDENLASADSVFGGLVRKMESLDLIEKSIIILTSDHGEFLGEKGRVFGHGGCFGDEGIHIPLIIRFPRDSAIKKPQKIKALVKMSDLFATLADIYQLEIQHGLIEGKSFISLLNETEQEINSYIVIGKIGTPGYCYRTKSYKLIYWEESGLVEFFDLEKDPEETKNIYKKNNIKENFFLMNLKKWLEKQQLIRKLLIKGDFPEEELDLKSIDRKTLENLKALGYIK